MDKTYKVNAAFQPTTKRNVDMAGTDFYPTPSWATHALLSRESFTGIVHEPACGDGAMSKVISEYGLNVISSDIEDHGYGNPNVDFLKSNEKVQNIITNPPYHSAMKFIDKCLDIVECKFALFLRLAFLEGVTRHINLYSVNPPSRVYVFSERVTIYRKGAEIAGSGTTAYAWYVWDIKNPITGTELKWIPPGAKRRFS